MHRNDFLLASLLSLSLAACGGAGGGGGNGCTDRDGDGFGDGCAAADCNDGDAAVHRAVSAYVDSDGDGHGVGAAAALCVGDALPAGYAQAVGDCVPDDPSAWSTVDVYLDVDRDGAVSAAPTAFCPATVPPGASSTPGLDCLDTNPLVRPGMAELADDGLDNDCDGGQLRASTGPGVYVASGPGCDDGAMGALAAPFCTLGAAVTYASANGVANVFVGAGTYLAGNDQKLWFPAGVSIFGGYTPSFDTLAGGFTVLGQLTDTCSAGSCTRVRVSGTGTETTILQRLAIRTMLGSSGTMTGLSVIGTETFVLADSKVEHEDTRESGPMFTLVQLASDVSSWLLRNSIGGRSTGSGFNYGVDNGGVARLVGNMLFVTTGAGGFRYTVSTTGPLDAAANVINGPTESTSGFGYGVYCQGAPRCALFGNVIHPGMCSSCNAVYSYATPSYLYDNVLVGSGASAYEVELHTGGGSPEWVLAGNDFHVGTAINNGLLLLQPGSTALDTIDDVNGCEIQGCARSEGNLNSDPGFVNPTEDPRAGDWHIGATSPCAGAGVDPGTDDPLGIYRIDLDGELRPLGSGFDCGADER